MTEFFNGFITGFALTAGIIITTQITRFIQRHYYKYSNYYQQGTKDLETIK